MSGPGDGCQVQGWESGPGMGVGSRGWVSGPGMGVRSSGISPKLTLVINFPFPPKAIY